MGEKLAINRWAEEDRPREKMAHHGVAALSNAELLAILIGSGNTEDSAVELMRKILSDYHNNLNELGKCSIDDLCHYKGIGPAKAIKQQPEITLNGRTLSAAETPILTEPMEQYQMAGTKGYVLVLPDEVASQLVGEKIRLAMKLEDGGYPELKSDLKQFLNSGKWQPELQSGQQLPEKVTMGVTVKAWGVANSLTGFTAISFCGLYLSIIFIILSCSVLAFEQLSAIDKNQKNYAVIDRLGVPGHRQASLIRRELSTVFLIPLLFPLLLTVLLITGAQFFFGEAILQQGLVPLYGLVTILLFCAIYLTYFGATMFLFKRVILRPEMR